MGQTRTLMSPLDGKETRMPKDTYKDEPVVADIEGYVVTVGLPVSDELPKGEPAYKVYNRDTKVLEHECRVLYYAYSYVFHAADQMVAVQEELGKRQVKALETNPEKVYKH